MTPPPAFDVVICGSLHLDIVVRAPHLPRPDETVPGRAWGRQCGGKGGNQALAAARAGARTAMIGRVGADEFGAALLGGLRAAGVDTNAVATDPATGSGMSVAIVREDGEYGAVIVSGANAAIPPASLGSAWGALGGARVLVLQNEVPEAVNLAAAVAARRAGAHIVLNAAPARTISAALRETLDVLIVNRVEAAMIGGSPVADEAQARAALAHLAALAPQVILTLGAEGALLQAPGEAPRRVAARTVRAASTLGAGDSFVGALAAELARGTRLADAAEAASTAAAAFLERSAAV